MAKEANEKKVLLYIKGEHVPFKATPDSTGTDLAASEDCYISGFSFGVIGLGIKTNFKSFVAGRSSLYKKNVIFSNGIGVIDADYRGEVKAVLYNTKEYGINISKGDILAQLITDEDYELKAVSKEEWDKWGEENPTERGEGGFGSTDSISSADGVGASEAINDSGLTGDDKSEADGEEAGNDSGAESNEADDSETSEAQSVGDGTSEDGSEQSAEAAEQGDEGDDKKGDVEKTEESKGGDNKTSAKAKSRK